MGGVAAGAVALALSDVNSSWILVLMALAGVLGGMAWGALPALLRTRFNTNEILTSLMLTYVAGLFLSLMVHGPLKTRMDLISPNLPCSTMPRCCRSCLIRDGRISASFGLIRRPWPVIYLPAPVGLRLRQGQAPKAARFAGFSESHGLDGVFARRRSGWIGGHDGGVGQWPACPCHQSRLWLYRHHRCVFGAFASGGHCACRLVNSVVLWAARRLKLAFRCLMP